MKKLALALMAAGILAAPSLASAAEPYVSLSTGLGIMHDQDITVGSNTAENAVEYDTGFAIQGAIGAKINNYRGEIEIGYQSNNLDKIGGIPISDTDISITAYMANAYADINVDNSVSPYLMAGLGFATVSGESEGASSDDTVFAYQIGTGISMKATDDVKIDLGYRYFATDDANDLLDGWEVSFDSSKILLGMRYNF